MCPYISIRIIPKHVPMFLCIFTCTHIRQIVIYSHQKGRDSMAMSDAQKKANKKYLDSMAEIKIRLKPEEKARWAEAAEAQGKSLQRLIIDAVEAAITEKEPEA